MPRLLDNWLETYGEWTVPRSEAPESLIIWAGLFTIASVAKRHVYFPKSLMGSYDIFPNLYVVYVGPAGVVRKSTTMGYGENLLMQTEHVNVAPTAMSASKLVEYLSETDDGSVSILSSEFATFMNISQEVMYDLLTDLYDGKLKHDYSTREHGLEEVENPCVNLLGATTPDWVSERMPEYALGGGFASRTIFIFENKVRQRKLYYRLRWSDYIEMEKKLLHDLAHIRELSGEFKHDSEKTLHWVEEWYKETADREVESEKVEGFANRRHVHAHKIAMLLSMAESDDLIVTRGHFEAAIKMLDSVEIKLPRVFSAVGRSPYSSDIESVRDYIEAQGKVERKRLLQRFYHNLTKDNLDEVLKALQVMGHIEKNGVHYHWKGE